MAHMDQHSPFALSLSKCSLSSPSRREGREGFDRLSPNGGEDASVFSSRIFGA
jgi:hypothetical protein